MAQVGKLLFGVRTGPAPRQCTLQALLELGQGEGLGEVVGDPESHGSSRRAHGIVGRHEDELEPGPLVAGPGRELQAVHARQVEVAQSYARRDLPAQSRAGALRILEGQDRVAELAYLPAKKAQKGRVVLDDNHRVSASDGSPRTAGVHAPLLSRTCDTHAEAIVNVFAADTAGSLHSWKLGSNNQWSDMKWELWNDGSNVTIALGTGIGVTLGYLPIYGDNMIIAAMPRGPYGTPIGAIDLVWRDQYDGRWNKLPEDIWVNDILAVTKAQPGVAYVPFDRFTNPSIGRFYLAWNPPDEADGPRAALMTESEGNNTLPSAASRRMQFRQYPIFLTNVWGIMQGNIALLHDLNFDQDWQLWGGITFIRPDGTRDLSFFPYTSGIFNSWLKDQDDYPVIKANLKCSFTGNCAM